ncbi:MAG TPA: choice-of-anchor R domain-containing protein [Thermoplasmata archaeon]|nr:choice-of-anchor R domain-containing protein [Thermoplasmata archaeon]
MHWGLRASTRATALALALVAMAVLGGPASAIAYQFYDGVSDPPPNYPTGGAGIDVFENQWGAQSFAASAAYVLAEVDLWAFTHGSTTDTSTVEIRLDSGGSPDMTTPALANGSARAASSYAWVAFPLAPQVQLSPGAVYWVVLESSAPSGGTGWSWWNTRNDTYIAPGVGEQSNDMGAKWSLAKGDFELRTFGYAEVGVVLAMAADRLGVRAGDTLTYTLWLNNSGTAPAGVVWINDTLPASVAYAWDNATDLGGVKVGNANWTFPGLSPGTHAFVLRVSVQGAAPPGAILTNVARLNYTDLAGASRPGSAVAITSIVIAAGGDAPFNLWIPFALGLLFGISMLVALVARPKGRVEQVFLVSQGGTLISHFSRTLKPHKDRDILAAMLTAVQSFIRDAFDPRENGGLKELAFGHRKILIRQGAHTFLAVVIAGRSSAGLARQMKNTLFRVEDAYHDVLARWSGYVDELVGADRILEESLVESRGPGARWRSRRRSGG